MNLVLPAFQFTAFARALDGRLPHARGPIPALAHIAGGVMLIGAVATSAAAAPITPGHLLVTRSVYQGTAATVTIGQPLPGGGVAVADGSYPFVWSNEGPDPSFGVTSPIFVDELKTDGSLVNSISVNPA